MPGDDPEALVGVGDTPVEHLRFGSERIAGIDGLVVGELVDAQERPAAFAQILVLVFIWEVGGQPVRSLDEMDR